MDLIYKASCDYCTAVASVVETIDVAGEIDTIPIESEEGRILIEAHHGEMVDSPHLFTDDRVYYGVGPTTRGIFVELPKAYIADLRR